MWLVFALVAYTIFAGVTLIDKYLLTRPIPDARVYAFYTGILGPVAFVLAPWGFSVPEPKVIALGLITGVFLIIAMYFFFRALMLGEASRVLVSWGGLVPILTLVFIYLGTGELPSSKEFIAFAMLIAGSVIITIENAKKVFARMDILGLVFLSAFMLGLYFAFSKFLFTLQPFISGFLWIKLGGALFALLFLLSPQVRKILFKHKKSPPKKAGFIFVVKNGSGGVAAMLQSLAVATASFGQVAIVNAMQGVQFALVFLGVIFLTKKFPKIVKENINTRAITVKLVGTGLVMVGIVVLAIA